MFRDLIHMRLITVTPAVPGSFELQRHRAGAMLPPRKFLRSNYTGGHPSDTHAMHPDKSTAKTTKA